MRLTVAAALLFASVAAAQAQTPLTGTTGPLAASPPGAAATPVGRGTEQVAPVATTGTGRRRATLQQRFDEANTTHDGHLTQEQARAKMPAVARQFSEIDTANHGYVTVDEIREHSKQVRAARRAARAAAAKPQ